MKLSPGLRVKPVEDTFVSIGGLVGMVIKTTDVFVVLWHVPMPARQSRYRGQSMGAEEPDWVLEREDGFALRVSETLIQNTMVPA